LFGWVFLCFPFVNIIRLAPSKRHIQYII
jgi:hypothetical protein